MPDVFLSYSRDDLTTARRFAEAFEREGFSVWWDQTLNPGEAFDEVTEKALNEAKAVVVLWSKKSVASRWVRAEATQANDSKTLVPVMIEPCKRPIMFELTHTADLSNWNGNSDDPAWQSYLAGVKRVAGREGVGTRSPVATAHAASPPMQFGVRTLIGVVALVILAAGVLWVVGRSPKVDPKPAGAVAAATSPAAAKEVTLAVLPFRNISSDPEQESFADGLSEELLNQLTQIRALRIAGRTSSFSFKDKNEESRVIADKLGVANLLVGTIRRDDKKIRITANLINGKDGTNLWSGKYDHELSVSGIIAVQEEIAKGVAKALSIKLDVGDMPRAQGGTTNLEAYDKYLQAQAILSQGFLGERILKAVQLLRDAVELDSAFVSAWARLADALRNAPLWKPESSVALLQEAAKAEARVLAMAPESQIAQFVRVERSLAEHRWSEAASAAERELGSGQEQFDVRRNFLASVGRIDELINRLEALRQQDPLNLTTSNNLQLYLDAAGRSAEALAEYERSRDLAGNHNQADFFAMLRHMARKDADPATVKATLRTVLKAAPVAIDPSLADKIYDKEAARAVLQKAFENPANRVSVRMGIIAMFAGAFGDRDLVIAALRRMVIDLHGPVANVWLAYEPGLHADPHFKDFVRDLGLDDYFRSSGNWGDFCKPVGKDDFECQ